MTGRGPSALGPGRSYPGRHFRHIGGGSIGTVGASNRERVRGYWVGPILVGTLGEVRRRLVFVLGVLVLGVGPALPVEKEKKNVN